VFTNKKIFSIRIHGIGGQGVKSIANVIAKAALASGYHIQAFPEFGPERRGAPVKAYVRISTEPILIRSLVRNPDFIILMEEKALAQEEVAKDCRSKDIFLLVNTTKTPQEINSQYSLAKDHHKIYCQNAESWVKENNGKVHSSISIIGYFMRITEIIKLDEMKDVLRQEFLEKIGEEKMRITDKVLEETYAQI